MLKFTKKDFVHPAKRRYYNALLRAWLSGNTKLVAEMFLAIDNKNVKKAGLLLKKAESI